METTTGDRDSDRTGFHETQRMGREGPMEVKVRSARISTARRRTARSVARRTHPRSRTAALLRTCPRGHEPSDIPPAGARRHRIMEGWPPSGRMLPKPATWLATSARHCVISREPKSDWSPRQSVPREKWPNNCRARQSSSAFTRWMASIFAAATAPDQTVGRRIISPPRMRRMCIPTVLYGTF